jgi:hypothetical protein
MADYGVKVTIPGKATTSIEPRDFAIWSKYSTMKTFLVGTYDYTFPSDLSSVTISISHNLGYHAAVWLSLSSTADSTWNTWDWWAYFYNAFGNEVLRFWQIYSLDNSIEIRYGESNTAGLGYNPTGETWSFKYYIFIEEIL